MASKKKPKRHALHKDRLQTLIAEATVDCYDDEEQLTGLLTMIEENVVFPFPAKVIGEDVQVSGIDSSGRGVLAVCERNGKPYRVELSSLDWREPRPEGFEWIEAYLAWREWNS
jgi:hypothetical protein